jgi:hypothetical protein
MVETTAQMMADLDETWQGMQRTTPLARQRAEAIATNRGTKDVGGKEIAPLTTERPPTAAISPESSMSSESGI